MHSVLGIFCFVAAIIGYYFIYKYNNDSMHPLAIMSFMWFFPAGIAMLQNEKWNPITIITIFFTGATIILFAVFTGKRNKETTQQSFKDFYVNDTYRFVTRCIFILCFIATIQTLRSNGWNLNVYTSNTAYDRKSSIVGYTATDSLIVAYLMQYVPYCALNSIYEIVYSKKADRKIVYNLFVVCFSIFTAWFVSFSRGTLLILLVGGLLIVNSKYSIKMKYLGIAGIGIIVLFYFLMTIRLDSSSYIFKGNFGNPIFNATYNYMSASYINFNEIVDHGSSYSLVTNTFQAVFKLLGYEISSNTYNNYILQGRPSTFINVFYEDGGLLMCIIYTFIECMIINYVYKQARSKTYYLLLLANLEKAIFIVYYSNYLFTYFTIVAQYIITFLICYISRHIKIKK